ncbi:hypothetical protein Tco_1482058 [Tanacetum coccineum]
MRPTNQHPLQGWRGGLESVRYGVSKVLDTAYWGFLGAQIRRIFLDGYGVLVVRTCLSTRSSTRNLFSPLEDPERTIRRRTRVNPNLLNDFEEINMAANGNGDDGPPPAGGEPDESLFEAWERYKLLIDRCPNHNMLPVTQIDTFYNGLTLRHRDTINAAADGTFMKRRPEECYDLIENMTAHHNDWDTLAQWSESSSSITSSNPEIVALKLEMAEIKQNSTNDLKNMLGQFMKMNNASTSGSGTLPSNTVTNPREDLKGITTQSGVAYNGPTIPTTSSPPKVVERKTEETKDTVPPTNNGSTEDVQPPVVQVETHVPIFEHVKAPTGRALIDVYEGELTLHVGNKAVTFNLDQTSRYSSNYDDNSVNRIDIIDVACEEYSQEFLGFSVKTDAFLAIEDEPISPEIDDSYYDSEGDILLLEEFLNDDPSSPPLPPQELKVVEPKNEKSSIDEPPEVELKDLPPHLEYAFLEGTTNYRLLLKDLYERRKPLS